MLYLFSVLFQCFGGISLYTRTKAKLYSKIDVPICYMFDNYVFYMLYKMDIDILLRPSALGVCPSNIRYCRDECHSLKTTFVFNA